MNELIWGSDLADVRGADVKPADGPGVASHREVLGAAVEAGSRDPEVVDPDHETLDPVDWDGFRDLSHRMVDQMLDLLKGVRDEPAWRPVPEELEARYLEPAPKVGIGAEATYDEFLELVKPYPTGTIHPRFWGWVPGAGTPLGMMASMLSGALNHAAGQFNDSGSRVEKQVLNWMKEALGFPQDAGGIVTSGGSVANLVGVAAARDAAVDFDLAIEGVGHLEERLVLYASEEVHNSIHKALQLLGLGRNALRSVPVDDAFEMRLDVLAEMIADDRWAGLRPFAVVGCAGTVNTGATDDLNAIADLCAREGLWFHVDGAFGAAAALSDEYGCLVKGIERADSVAFDFHKWMSVPYEAGGVLVRDVDAMKRPFTAPASYLDVLPRGAGAQPDPTSQRGTQLSRGFKALKVWMTIKGHGLEKLGRMVTKNIEQAKHLEERIGATPGIDLLAPRAMNVVCFRVVPEGVPEEELDAVNREVLMRLQERGIAVPSSTRIHGRFALRVANCNHRATKQDFDLLVDASLSIAEEVAAEGRLHAAS